MTGNRQDAAYKYKNLLIDPASLDEVMLFYVHKGETGWE